MTNVEVKNQRVDKKRALLAKLRLQIEDRVMVS